MAGAAAVKRHGLRASLALVLLCAAAATADAAARRLPDPAHSGIEFGVDAMGTRMSGRFAAFDARIDFDPGDPDRARVAVRVDTTSLTTGDDDADTVACGPDWLDCRRFPQAHFESREVHLLDGDRFEAVGRLMLRGQWRPLTVPFTAVGAAAGAQKIEGRFDLPRKDWNIGRGQWSEDGLVGDDIHIRFHLLLPAAAPATATATHGITHEGNGP